MARPAFRAGAAHVRVPATSANLGPGFDSLGLALSLYDDVIARVGEEGLQIDIAGEGADDLPRDGKHLVVRSMHAVFDRLGGQPRGIELVCANRIPQSRGLGSSAAAIVAGTLLARALVVGGDEALPDSELLAVAAGLEGHADNVAAALHGGLTVAWAARGRPVAVGLQCHPAVTPVVFIPASGASTVQARGLLPAEVSHADAVFNASRSALLVAALTGRPELLFAATEDRLHQPYRASAMAASAELIGALRDEGLAAVLSGAGPSVLVLAAGEEQAKVVAEHAPDGWRVELIPVDTLGAHLVR